MVLGGGFQAKKTKSMTFNYKSGSCVDDLELLNEQKVNTDSNDGAENLDQERD